MENNQKLEKLKWIHFVIDDKFISDSIKCFVSAQLTINRFVYATDSTAPYNYLKPNEVEKISLKEARALVVNDNIDVICLHSFFALPPSIINVINKNICVIWFAWGADLYSNPKPTGPFLDIGNRFLPRTERCLKNLNRSPLRLLKSVAVKLMRRTSSTTATKDEIYQAVNRVDFFSGVFPNEYEMMKNSLTSFRAKQIVHNYIHPEEFKLKDLQTPLQRNGNNILLGNSGTYYINHIDLMHMLKGKIADDISLISPLSYQGSPTYIKSVIDAGKSLFGNQFKPLKGYLPFEEYNKIMNSCDTLILGQKQQAATCNCLTAMWNGLKLYLPENSMNYIFYKSLGLKIFSVEKYKKNDVITKEEVMSNRRIIERFYSFRQWQEDLKNTIIVIKEREYGSAN